MGSLLCCRSCRDCFEADLNGERTEQRRFENVSKKKKLKAQSQAPSGSLGVNNELQEAEVEFPKTTTVSPPITDHAGGFPREHIKKETEEDDDYEELVKDGSCPQCDFKTLFSDDELYTRIQQKYENKNFKYRFGGIYIGEVANGKRGGRGKMTWPDGEEYEGEWRDGLPRGSGTMRMRGKTFCGEWRNPSFKGEKVVVEARLARLEEWLQAFNDGFVWLWYNQRISDEAREETADSLYEQLEKRMTALERLMTIAKDNESNCQFARLSNYFGCVRDGKPEGIGMQTYRGGCFYRGEWENGQTKGVGIYQWTSTRLKKGEMVDAKINGFGVEITGNRRNCGLWEEGKLTKVLTPSAIDFLP